MTRPPFAEFHTFDFRHDPEVFPEIGHLYGHYYAGTPTRSWREENSNVADAEADADAGKS